MSEPAGRRLQVTVESEPLKRLGGLRTIIRGVVFFFTEGAVSAGSKTSVLVVDRQTGEVVPEHDWGRSPDAAARDRDALEARLAACTVDEFCSEYGLDPLDAR